MTLKCCMCVDKHITDGGSYPDPAIADACTIVPVVQTFNVGGQQIAAPVSMPVCYGHREEQLGKVSKAGLVTV